MGRKVEQTMVHVAVRAARAQGVEQVHARYIPTERNGPCLAFWKDQSGFESREDAWFVWNSRQPYALPEPVTLIDAGAP